MRRRSAPRCAPTRHRPPRTAGPTGRWPPSCAYLVPCSTWSSVVSGTSTRRGRPEQGWRMTSSAEVAVSDQAAPEPAAPRRPTFTWVRLLQVVGGLGLAVFLLGWALPYFAHTT